jgi:hypothetical protein
MAGSAGSAGGDAVNRSAVPKNPLQIKGEISPPPDLVEQPSEAELREVAAMLKALYSPRSKWRRSPWPWPR